MKALNDKLIVKKLSLPEKTAGGLYMPDTAKEKSLDKLNVGVVVSFGPGTVTVSGEFLPGYRGAVGDIVVWEVFGHTEAKILGENYVFVRSEDLTAQITKEEAEKMGFSFDNEAGK